MNFTSMSFYIIILIALFFYYIISMKFQWKYLLLLSILMYFFLATKPFTLIYVIFTGLTIYVAGRMIESNNKVNKTLILVLVIGINIALLLSLKGSDLYASLGISYYTLSAIGYITDVYWGQKCERNPFKLLLFICWFPLLVSGPICRFSELNSEFSEAKKFNYNNFCFGCQRILWGVFKKLVIASRLEILVNTIYSDKPSFAGIYIIIAMFAFVILLYCDFSGCMDIALGVALIFGIKLPENFNSPFASHSIQEFWQRWHITLGQWAKRYIMYPILKSQLWNSMRKSIRSKMGKDYSKKIPTYLAMLILWLILGLWHGIGWNFFIGIGLYYGVLMILEDSCAPLCNKINTFLHIRTESYIWKTWQSFRTFSLVAIGSLAFKSENLSDIPTTLRYAFSKFNILECLSRSAMSRIGLDIMDFSVCILTLLILFGVEKISKKENIQEKIAAYPTAIRWVIWYTLFLIVILWGLYGDAYIASNFIYEQF